MDLVLGRAIGLPPRPQRVHVREGFAHVVLLPNVLHGVELLANLSSVQLFPTWHTRSAVVLAGTGGLWVEGMLRGAEQGEEATPLCRLPGGAELLLRRATTLLPALDALRVRGALWSGSLLFVPPGGATLLLRRADAATGSGRALSAGRLGFRPRA